MKELMTADTSHVLRRPGSVCSNLQDPCPRPSTCCQPTLTMRMEALHYLNNKNEVQRDEAETRRHISTLQTFLTHDQGRFREFSIKVVICTSRIFVGVFSALQVSTAFKNPQWWAERRPTKCYAGHSNRSHLLPNPLAVDQRELLPSPLLVDVAANCVSLGDGAREVVDVARLCQPFLGAIGLLFRLSDRLAPLLHLTAHRACFIAIMAPPQILEAKLASL